MGRITKLFFRVAREVRRIDRRLLAAVVVAAIALILVPTITHDRRDLNAVVGPAGGSVSRPQTGSPLPQPRPTIEATVTVRSGDTLLGTLSNEGVDPLTAERVVAALSPLFGPNDLRPGQRIVLSFAAVRPTPEWSALRGPLASARIAVDPTRDIVVSPTPTGDFTASIVPQRVVLRQVLASGQISDTVYDSASRAQVPPAVLMEVIRAYSFGVDFQRDVQPGDRFDLIYQKAYDHQGRFLYDGRLLFANLTLHGEPHEIFEYTTSQGYVDYFDRDGHSVRKMLMRTPVQGAWISSVFGWRKNPINGYNEFHRGLDFAVPSSTPIMAAGNGTVAAAGYDQDYGNYLRLSHRNGYQTLYGHMAAFARGIRVGTVVSQGEVIGYVGTTGMSTGPHLHYEVIYRGERINPATVVSPSGPTLDGDELARFTARRRSLEEEYTLLEAQGSSLREAQGSSQREVQEVQGAVGPLETGG